ncbi:hypothetical protein I4U23_026304 [Adineta vaga]|nr:hypothetical protein I4U23_026304 [Adineta vaga]
MKFFVSITIILLGAWCNAEVIDDSDDLPSIAYSVFLNRDLDPYCDSYMESVLRMPMAEILDLPKIDDASFFFNTTRGIEMLPAHRTVKSLFDETLDDELISQSAMDGEFGLLMSSGPATINFVSSVMTLSSKKDYAFTTEFNFTHIKYPNSFRATLVQTSNEMYRALMAAHTGMNRIQTNMKQLPTYLKTALKLISQGTSKLIKSLLPLQLNNIDRITHECSVVANTTLKQYEDLMDLLLEIAQVNTLTQSEKEKENAKLQETIAKEKEAQKLLEKNLQDTKERYANITKELEEKQKAYNAAVQAIPENANALGYQAYYHYRGWFGWCKRVYYRPHPDQGKYNQALKDKADQALTELQHANERYRNMTLEQQIQQTNLENTIHSIALTNLDSMNLDEYIDIVRKAAGHVGDVIKQWQRMVEFFSELAIKADATKTTVAERFLSVIELMDGVNGAADMNSYEKEFYLQLLVEASQDIDGDAHLLFLMAKTYYDVSREYMVNQIAGVSGLLGVSTDEERTAHMQKMSNDTTATAKKLKIMINSRANAYALASEKRQEEYNVYLETATLEELTGIVG